MAINLIVKACRVEIVKLYMAIYNQYGNLMVCIFKLSYRYISVILWLVGEELL